MEIKTKLHILADAAKYDASCSSSGSKRSRNAKGIGDTNGVGICHSYTPDGRCVSLLKILLTNFCIYDCLYCINRISSNTPRARFTVPEVVNLTLDFYRRNYIEGLFLSSGIIQNSDYTMEQLVAVAKSLRTDHLFNGYIHLKGIPGASKELLEEAGRWADRISVNIELPSQPDLDRLAPAKSHKVIEKSMAEVSTKIDEIKADKKPAQKFAPAGQTTQMIVGATPSTDALILSTSAHLYKAHSLRRIYYSAYSPTPQLAMGVSNQATPLVRENRLYQADWLFRFYGFSHSELTTAEQPNLDLHMDPKLSWALRNRDLFPVDVNTACRATLLRVPGLGVRTVDRIIQARRFGQIHLGDLKKLRVPIDKAGTFLMTADFRPSTRLLDSLTLKKKIALTGTQLQLFDSSSALSGEL